MVLAVDLNHRLISMSVLNLLPTLTAGPVVNIHHLHLFLLFPVDRRLRIIIIIRRIIIEALLLDALDRECDLGCHVFRLLSPASV